jgi:hypothetical protein
MDTNTNSIDHIPYNQKTKDGWQTIDTFEAYWYVSNMIDDFVVHITCSEVDDVYTSH